MDANFKALLLEWIGLLCIAPFLVFPTFRPRFTLLALVVLVALWGVISILRKCPWPSTPFNGALLLFALMLGVGIGTTTLPELTLPKAAGLILGIAVLRAVAWTAPYRKAQWMALIGFCALGLVIIVVGVAGVSWTLKIPALQKWIEMLPQRMIYLPEAPERGISPNQLAGAIAFFLPLPLAVLLHPRISRRTLFLKLPALLGLLLLGGVLILTQSRSGWLGAGAGAIALIVLICLADERRWLKVAGAILPVMLVVGASLLIWWLGPDRVGEALYGAAESFVETPVGRITYRGRLEIWSRALYAIADFPFTGCGLGTFRRIVHTLYPLFLVSPGNDIAHAHNIFLQTALDLGIPGLMSYLALLWLALFTAWKVAASDAEMRPFVLGLSAGLVALHVYGLTDALALGSKPGIIFWMGLGLLASMNGCDTEMRRTRLSC